MTHPYHKQEERTEGPWQLGPFHKDGSVAIHSPKASVFHLTPFSTSAKQAKANAEFIVRLANAEKQVVEALERIAASNVDDMDTLHPNLCAQVARVALAVLRGGDDARS